MDVGWIEDLIALEEHETLARAAASRHVTQPAFSRRIAAIEDWCGAPLVDRSRRPLRLLAEARALLPDLRAAASTLSQLRQDLRQSQTEGARVVIAAQHSLAISLMPKLYEHMANRIPTAKVRMRSSNRADGLVLLLTGVADVLICHETDRHPLAFAGVDSQRLRLKDDVLIPVTGDAAFARHVEEAVRTGDMLELPCVIYPSDSFLGRVLQDEGLVQLPAQFSYNGLIETALTPAVARFTAGRALVSWLPLSLIEEELTAGALHRLPPELGEIALKISVVCLRSGSKTATSQLWRCLEELARH